ILLKEVQGQHGIRTSEASEMAHAADSPANHSYHATSTKVVSLPRRKLSWSTRLIGKLIEHLTIFISCRCAGNRLPEFRRDCRLQISHKPSETGHGVLHSEEWHTNVYTSAFRESLYLDR